MQGCTNPGRQISRVTKFCAVAHNICVSSVRNLMSLFWDLEFCGGFYIFGKYVDPSLNACLKDVTLSPNSPKALICVQKKHKALANGFMRSCCLQSKAHNATIVLSNTENLLLKIHSKSVCAESLLSIPLAWTIRGSICGKERRPHKFSDPTIPFLRACQ